jgi:hypothetical protein
VARPCPCGCGRSLRFGDRRAADRALSIRSLLPAFEHAVEIEAANCESAPAKPDQPADWDALLAEGEDYADRMLELAHHDEPSELMAADGAIDLRAHAKRWEQLALTSVRVLSVEDPEWFAAWAGPRRAF